jgi:hypothetical protein
LGTRHAAGEGQGESNGQPRARGEKAATRERTESEQPASETPHVGGLIEYPLDRETLTEFLRNRKPKIRLDFLLEEAAGKKLTREECEVLLVAIGKKIRKLAVEYFL